MMKQNKKHFLLFGGLVGGVFLIGMILLLSIIGPEKILHKAAEVKSKVPGIVESTKRDLEFGLAQSTPAKPQEAELPQSTLAKQQDAELPQNTPTKQQETDLPQPVVTAAIQTSPTAGPLRVNPSNRRYFMDKNGKTVYLTGSHTWQTLQDSGSGFPPPVFGYTGYLDFLTLNNHNFFRLWTWEQSRWTLETTDNSYWFDPMPYQRVGPGNGLDGKLKFDLTKFNQAYFDRMKTRVSQARDRGIYVSIMLFDGWSVANDKGGYSKNNPWKGHPFNGSNNINGINGDPNGHNNGLNTQDLSVPAVTAIQEAYIKKVIDTLNDLDNVLYEIDNEGDGTSYDWQVHMVNLIKTYQATKPRQHPVGMTALYPGGWDPDLFASPADWISPNNDFDYLSNPPKADGSKVILTDSDHLCGICYDHIWVWKSFTRGMNVIYMDGYDGLATGQGAADFNKNDPELPLVRKNMGYTLAYAKRMNITGMVPRGDLCSTGYCLANNANNSAEFLVYSPTGGKFDVNLTGITSALQYEWLDPRSGKILNGGLITGGGLRNFTPPFNGDAVLYITRQVEIPSLPFKEFLPSMNKSNQIIQPVAMNDTKSTSFNGLVDMVEHHVDALAVALNALYLPLIINSNSPIQTGNQFHETFDGMPVVPQPWQPSNWDVTIHSRNETNLQNLTTMQADHGSQCQPPPATHEVSTYADSVFICHDHVMTALNDPDYGVIYLTPNRLVDFSGGEVVISFDVSTRRTSVRDWIDLWITPFQENLQLPLEDWLPDLDGPPRNAVHIKMDSYGGATPFIGEVYKNFSATALTRNTFTGFEQFLTPSPTRRDNFELRISQGHIRFGMPAYNVWWIDTNIQALDWSKGVIQFGHHSYNPGKDCPANETCGPNTWHWDNVEISNSVPFSILHADKRYVDGTVGGEVIFSAPTPGNAFLRFAGIGNSISVSFDGGKTWKPCLKQPQIKQADEHYASYFTPIPQGVTKILLKGQDWWGGAWHARDITVWSLTQ